MPRDFPNNVKIGLRISSNTSSTTASVRNCLWRECTRASLPLSKKQNLNLPSIPIRHARPHYGRPMGWFVFPSGGQVPRPRADGRIFPNCPHHILFDILRAKAAGFLLEVLDPIMGGPRAEFCSNLAKYQGDLGTPETKLSTFPRQASCFPM